MKKWISLFGVVFVTLWLAGCSAESNVKKGDKFYAIGEYFEAAAEYRKAYMRTKPKERAKRGERAYKAADCYRRINYTSRAIGSYQNAARYNYPDSIVYFYLAEMQRKNGDYKKALQNYEIYLQYKPDDVLARHGLQGCTMAPIWKQKPTLYSIKKEPLLNARRSDYCPMLTGDDMDMLYLTSTRPQATGNELSGITGIKSGDIFISRKDDKGKWQSPEQVESEINSEYDEGACAFSPDGKTMYFTRAINRRMKEIGERLGIGNISTYTARHSFATVLKRAGANIAYISESLGHQDLKTTENYLASFEREDVHRIRRSCRQSRLWTL
jgi:tetratricopeptide (TPR) repeat protein